MKYSHFLIGCFLLTSCGYQIGQGDLSSRYSTITVPYVSGDRDGSLTAILIKQLTTSATLRYVNEGGDLKLKVEIVDFRDENIGFRYDRNKEGELIRSIIPTETRTTVFAEITLTETLTGKVILGPARLAASIEYDHDYYSTRDGINTFSLGQLSDYDAARDDMMKPLNQTLAQKIVDYVGNSW